MTDFASLLVPDRGQKSRTIHLVDKDNFDGWLAKRPASDKALLAAHRFDGKSAYAFALLPRGDDFEVVSTVANVGEPTPWCLAKLGSSLPEGIYKLAGGEPGPAALGWLLAQHRNDTYRSTKDKSEPGDRILVTGEPARIEETIRLAEATALVRDLVDTPAADMGPGDIEKTARDLAKAIGAEIVITSGKDLDDGYPLIAAVGRAATKERAPRLIELTWGNPDHPRLAIVGKGVCFDTGGLDIKGGTGMRLMKKDMGGAAHALALAKLVAEERLPVRLHLLVPAVENSVSADAYRPGDIVKSRKGLFVEIDNTDAEGRLILADALAKAVEGEPERIVDFATLTGAARIALGPDLPAFFANDESFAEAMLDGAKAVDDPVWRMPLWDPYDEMLKSDIADLANAANSPMAGCITAAMFLKRFVPDSVGWGHFDTFAWRDAAKPGRPKGGDALGLRAAFATIKALYPRK